MEIGFKMPSLSEHRPAHPGEGTPRHHATQIHSCKAQEHHEHVVEPVEAAEDAAETLEPAKQPLDFVASTIPDFAVRLSLDTRRERGNQGNEAKIERELGSLITIIRAVHEQAATPWQARPRMRQVPSGRRIAGLSRRRDAR